MKKSIVIIFVFYLSTIAQNQKFSWGIQAGINLSKLNGGHIEQVRTDNQVTSNTSYNFGIYSRYILGRSSAINTAILYIEKGSQWIRPFYIPFFIGTQAWDGDYVGYEIKYLELPIHYEYFLFRYKNSSELINLLIGPFFSYVHNSSDEWGFELAPSEDVPSDDLGDNINNFDFGFTFGIKAYLGNNEHVFINVKYDISLVNLHKNGTKRAAADLAEKKNLKMRSLIIFLGLNF
jgi:hypothetical protein